MRASRDPLLAGWRSVAVAVIGFGVAFGFVEAAVVVDLRTIYEPIQIGVHPETRPGELFPALTLEQLRSLSPRGLDLLKVEVTRELATMVMLASVGLAVGGHPVRRFAAFVMAFGVWDLAFYLFLRLLLSWPASLGTWDILFLIPVPWSSPVAAPMLVAAVMVACGLHTIAREQTGRPIRPTLAGWAGLIGAGAIIIAAFLENYRVVMSGGVPTAFDWPLHGVGLGLALLCYAGFARGKRCQCEDGKAVTACGARGTGKINVVPFPLETLASQVIAGVGARPEELQHDSPGQSHGNESMW